MIKSDEKYINKVLSYILCSRPLSKRIKEDLAISILEKRQIHGDLSAEQLLGKPLLVAKEFIDNLDLGYRQTTRNFYYYVSKRTVFGVPLVHINNRDFKVVKGIIAIGNISVGVISLGGLSFGLISFGGLSFALLLGLGGCAISLGVSISAVAISYLASIGAVAVAKVFAVGAVAHADMTIGAVTKGIVGFYADSSNCDFSYLLNSFNLTEKIDKFSSAIKMVKGKIPILHNLILRILSIFNF